MPNHVHGIVIINKLVDTPDTQNVGTQSVETQNFASLRITKSQPPNNQFGPQSKNLGSIIRGYKIGVTIQSKIIAPDFKWQSRYHDHIIRNEAEYHRIEEYILKNPINWKNDKFYKSEKLS
jgi:REP element-mobilizing transposase RayT